MRAPELIDADAAGNHAQHRIVRCLAALRLLPVATIEPASAQAVGRTLVDAGLPCLEIAFRTPNAAEAIRRASEVNGLLVGAGTIQRPEQAEEAANAGAAFAVAPGLSEDVVECCRNLGLPFFPGVATPTEVERARRLGLRTLKVFPVTSLGGPGFVRALSAVYPDTRFIPTGGIDLATLADYLSLPNVLACGGSWLIKQAAPDDADLEALGVRVRQTMERTR